MLAIIVDLELTKSALPRIIQIGAVTVDLQRFKIVDYYSKTANPGEKVCQFIEELTGITQERLDQSEKLEDVLKDFFQWAKKGGQPKALYSWGEGDLIYIRSSALALGISPPRFVGANVKEFFKIVKLSKQEKIKGGLKTSLEQFELKFYGREHDALVDSFNTARLMFQLIDQLRDHFDVKKKGNYKERRDKNLCEEFKEKCLKDFNYREDYFPG